MGATLSKGGFRSFCLGFCLDICLYYAPFESEMQRLRTKSLGKCILSVPRASCSKIHCFFHSAQAPGELGTGSCEGDSGGPLTCECPSKAEDTNPTTLCAIVSGGKYAGIITLCFLSIRVKHSYVFNLRQTESAE